MALRISTWNINSVRLRQNLILRFLREKKPDILCLQETKCPNDQFPCKVFIDAGYEHIFFEGMKSYNGVAIISRLPLTSVSSIEWAGRKDCRHISAITDDGLELHNFYVPAGGDEPDPQKNEKFGHKLLFLEELRAWFKNNRSTNCPMILVGDLNIAPLEHDVWSHKQLLKVVSHTPIEVELLVSLQNDLQWIDTVRYLVPEPQKLFSWWSYRAKDWSTADKGRRLDHIWVTEPLKNRIISSSILRSARDWEKPSDHVPVTTDFS